MRQGLVLLGVLSGTRHVVDAGLVSVLDLEGFGEVRFEDVSAGVVAVDIPKESLQTNFTISIFFI